MHSEKSIKQLPADTRTKLRSTQILTSLPQIISELLQNALDADAHQINIGVDCEEWTCWVRDDGSGISKENLSILGRGSEEGRYGTSKLYTPNSFDSVLPFGFRGEALSSAADLSCLEISSRTSRCRESWSVILKGGKNLYNGPAVRWRRESAGTVVCIRDAFYNLPIRRLSHPTPARCLELIRQDIEAFALVCHDVSFSLENTSRSRGGNSTNGHILKVPKTPSSKATFRHIFGRALVEHCDEVNASSGKIKLEGFISLHGAHSKAYQFLYINRHPISTCDLHRVIDNRFSSSSFTKHAYDEGGESSIRSSVRRSPRKSERKPVYVLNLSIPPRHIDNCLEPAKATVQFQNSEAVSSLLSSVVQSFLIHHGFVSRGTPDRTSSRPDNGSPSPRKKRRLTPETRRDETNVSTSPSILHDSIDVDTQSISPSLYIHHNGNAGSGHGKDILWKDPATNEVFIVDQRTGNSHYQGPSTGQSDEHHSHHDPLHRRTMNPIHLQTSERNQRPLPEWIQQALEANQTYALMEPRIPSLTLSSAFASELHHRESDQEHHSTAHYFQPIRVGAESTEKAHRFSKAAILNAQVINQVDRKFVACLMDDHLANMHDQPIDLETGGKVLVLIDQHAADERIRVERFLKELCLEFLPSEENEGTVDGVKRKVLSPPVPVLLTIREALQLANMDIQRSFDVWGFRFMDLSSPISESCAPDEDTDNVSGDGYVQVLVSTIPDVVSEKLLVGDELCELIKGFLSKLELDGSSLSVPAMQVAEFGDGFDSMYWLKALRWCPRELLDLVNSKACRGAVMFNDSLTLEQCERLVRQLSEASFPFHCAHGRPSLVPLASVASLKDLASRRMKPRKVQWNQYFRSRSCDITS